MVCSTILVSVVPGQIVKNFTPLLVSLPWAMLLVKATTACFEAQYDGKKLKGFSSRLLTSLCQKIENQPLTGIIVIGEGQSARATALSGSAMKVPVLWAKGGTASLNGLHQEEQNLVVETTFLVLRPPSAVFTLSSDGLQEWFGESYDRRQRVFSTNISTTPRPLGFRAVAEDRPWRVDRPTYRRSYDRPTTVCGLS
ncbi:hypothetical protein DMENIID0001_125380 [Sergentomyia squamirostris]